MSGARRVRLTLLVVAGIAVASGWQAARAQAEGVAVDSAGNIYGAEVGPRKLQKYVKK